MAFMAAAAPYLMAAGAVVSAVGAIQQGQMAAKQANMQADLLNQQAAQEREIAEQESDDYRARMSRAMASRRAILGGSGVEPGAGSPLLVSEDMARDVEYQALKIRSGGLRAEDALRKQAALTRWGGQAEKRASYVRAGASLLGGIGNAYSSAGKKITTNDSGRIVGPV